MEKVGVKALFTCAVLTISDSVHQGQRQDTSGQTIKEVMASQGFRLLHTGVVPDEAEAISETLQRWSPQVDLILTTGGTGLGPRDVTPEATLRVIERPVPGLAEAMRLETMKHTAMSILSRGVAGVKGRCLIINLPGSPKAVRECLDVLTPVLPHAMEILKGNTQHHLENRKKE